MSATDTGNRPIHYFGRQEGVREGNVTSVFLKRLISRSDVDIANYHGETALHIACTHGQLEIAKILLDNQANPDARTHTGATPLLRAVSRGHVELVILLIEKGISALASSHFFI
jgi:ankyrin repeat protein